MLAFENPIIFGSDLDASVQLRNCSPPEDGFVWSGGRWCEVEFELDLARQPRGRSTVEVSVDLDVFKYPPAFPGQNVLTYLNGARIGSAFLVGRSMLAYPVRTAILQPTGNILTFDLPDAIRPSEFGVEDERMLGVQLFSLAIEAAA